MAGAKVQVEVEVEAEAARARQFLQLAKAAQSKQDLRLVLLSLISSLLKGVDSPRFYDDLYAEHEIYAEIFAIFCEKILGIFTQGDILDCAFLYLAFIAPESSSAESSNANPIDDRFSPFITSAQKLLASSPSQEEAIMLIELGAIARVLAHPAKQRLSFFHNISQKISAKPTINSSNTSKKVAQVDALDSGDSVEYCDDDGMAFFLSRIIQTNIASSGGMGAARAAEFLIELFSIPYVGFSYIIHCITRAFSQENPQIITPIITRNICNWQLHILWNAKNLFNNPQWLLLYDVWKRAFYDTLANLDLALSQAQESQESGASQNLDSRASAMSAATPTAISTATPTASSARMSADSALDLALYLQFFIYHMCGNSFRSQEQWHKFNAEISKYASKLYARYANTFLPALPIDPPADLLPDSPDHKPIIIGILRDRLVENSPFKVEYSLLKNLLASPDFRKHFTIKIYCMSLIEKSENNPEVIAKIAALGIETIDIGLAFNRAEFYNSHLQKSLALREIIIKDRVRLLISPNNGYGISDFLLASRCASVQAFWSHGNYVYDVAGIDARLTHICNNQQHITHGGAGSSFGFYGIPVQMDRDFYNPTIPQEAIQQARAHVLAAANPMLDSSPESSPKSPESSKAPASSSKISSKTSPKISSRYLFGTIGRLVKLDSIAYLRSICAILEQRPNWSFLACGLGNEREIVQKISHISPDLVPRFIFSGYVDSAAYGHVLDFWADSFPMEQGESRIEYVAKSRGVALRHYAMSRAELESMLISQLDETRAIIERIIDELKSARPESTLESKPDLTLDSSLESSAPESTKPFIDYGILDSGILHDFASYKELVLGFNARASAFSEQEYIDKACAIMRAREQGADSMEHRELLAMQSTIHWVNSEIKARLGVKYFLEFASSALHKLHK